MNILVKVYCEITGENEEMYIDSSPDLIERIDAWKALPLQERSSVQTAFGDLNSDEREFILTGITPTIWKDVFGNLSGD